MKLNLKKTSIALAIASASGAVFAAPVTTQLTQTANDTVLGNNYQQTFGSETIDAAAGTVVSQKDINTGNLVSSTAQAVDGPEVQIGGINYRNYTYQEIRKGTLEARNEKNATSTVNGTTTDSSSLDKSTKTGQATRTAKTRVELDKTINPATEIAGTKERLDDTTFTFAADDVNTVIGANTTSEKVSSEDVTYAAADERTNSDKFSQTTSDLTTKAKLGADGKPVAGQVIRVGTVENVLNEDNAYYKSTVDASTTKVTSKNANGILSSEAENTSDHKVLENYQTNGAGDVVAFNLSANKKSIAQSTVDTNKSASSDKYVEYDDVNAAGLDFTNESKFSNDNSKESLLDGFVAVDKSAVETTTTQYNQAALGTSNALDNIETLKSSSEKKTRDFVKNAAGEIVLTNGKPTVNTEVMETATSEKYDSVYQPTRFAAANADRGIVKGDAYNQHILNNGFPTLFTDENVAKSTEKRTSSKVTTHKQDNNFQTWEKSTEDNSSTYARNQQENIEVNRDISNSKTADNKFLSKISGVSVVKEEQASDFKIGTVAVDVDGNEFTAADIHTWKDETGKERYYVVIDNDDEGNQVRSEVTFKNGKPLETKAAEIQTVKTDVGSTKRTDKVTMGAEVAYQTNKKETWDKKTTSKDGATVYAADKRSNETNVKVFSVGKNALHREAVETKSRETVGTEFETINVGGTDKVIFKDGKPVVVAVESNKSASNVTDRLFQDGQDKANEQIKTSSYEGNRKNAAGVVQGTWAGHDNSTTVDYAAGKELAKTIVKDKADEETSKAITTNVGFNYDGTAKANIGSNTLRDNGTVDAGLAVKDAKAGDIVVDTKLNTSNKEDTKTYQDGGVKALESTTAKTDVQTVTYADGTTGTIKSAANNQESTVTLFNKGKADKYREAVNTTQAETTGKTYKTDADGDIILANGKPVEQGTSSDKQTVKTTENLYQIGQERKTDKVEVTDTSEKTANVDGSSRDLTAKATNENITYRAGQKDGKATEKKSTTASELKATKADATGYTYKVNSNDSTVTNATEMHLLATHDVQSVVKSEWNESLAATGKNAVSITRGTEFVNRTDESSTDTIYGSETVTAATGTTTVAKKSVGVTDKFGTLDSSTLSRTETKVAADKSATSNTATRVDSVNGVVLTETLTNTDVAGKTSTNSRTTSLNASGLTTDRITLNGRDLQTELNNMGNAVDDVQRKAYRGIAIALAAQQAVPNIKPGQVAVFGGVGHYEGETAGSIGVVTSFTDRISASGAFGFAGGDEFGGRVGIAYVFGGN